MNLADAVYSQRDPKWSAHTLGYGPSLGTIGAYGCVDTVKAMIATYAGYPINPRQINDLFVTKKIFTKDPTGTYDFLPDNALALLWPDRFKFVGSYPGLRSDLITKALPTPDQYIELHIHSTTVPTHRVWVVGGTAPNFTIADPWDAKIKPLSAYGRSSAISKTIINKEIIQPPIVKPPSVPIPPPVIDPGPVIVAPPIPPVVIPVDPVVKESATFWQLLYEWIKKYFGG